MREGRPGLEHPETFAEALLQPVRLPGVPVNFSPVWPD